MSKVTPTPKRKSDHIRINLEEDVASALTTGLERYRFVHNAVPELDLRSIDTRSVFLGKELKSPLLISSMTGGVEQAGVLNRRLAEAAQASGIAMALGSMRVMLEQPAQASTFQVRAQAPDILLMANLGAVQLNYGVSVADCRRLIEAVEADALILHFNPLQEALQPEGDVRFADLLQKVEKVCRRLDVPVIAKEVGWGFSVEAATRLAQAGVAAIDVAGAGGTSWSQVEMHRAVSDRKAHIASQFVDWGIPTAESLVQIHRILPDLSLIASGGLRSGVDVAKCLALGAKMAGLAGPFLKAASHSTQAVVEVIEDLTTTLRIAMFAAGCADLGRLAAAPLIEHAP